MKDWRSQVHVKWDCKYHVVIVPKYRQRVFFGRRRKQIGEVLRQGLRQIETVARDSLPSRQPSKTARTVTTTRAQLRLRRRAAPTQSH